MKKNSGSADLDALRKKAEDQLPKNLSESEIVLSEAEMLKLIRELKVHQIELEMQNDELVRAKAEADDAVSLYDLAPSGYFTLSAEGEILKLNLCGSQMLGKDRSSLINSRLGFFVSDDTKPVYNDFLDSVFNSNVMETCEITLSTHDNVLKHVQLTGKISENCQQCFVIATDNTRHIQADELIKASEEKYRLMFANNPQPMWIFDVETLAFLEVNQAAINLYGYSAEEFLSMTIKDIRPPEDIPELLKYVEPTDLKFKEIGVFRHVKKNGEILNVQITWHSVISNGRKARHILVNDVTKRMRAEALRREAHDRLLKIAGQLPGVIYQFRMYPDGKFCFSFVSEALYDIFGIRPEVVCENASGLIAYFHPDDKAGILAAVLESAKDLSPWQQEFRMKVKDGTIQSFLGNASPQMEDDGSILWHGFLTDITEHKRAEKALQESEANLSAVIGATDESILVVSADNTLLSLNKIAAQRMGHSRKEVIGCKIDDLLPPEVVKQRLPFINRLLATRESVKFEDERNGQWMINHIYPILNAENQVIRMAIFSRDITERKRAEEALKISEVRYRTMFENSLTGILITHPDGAIIAANPEACRLLGRSEADICRIGRNGVLNLSDPNLQVYLSERKRTGYYRGELSMIRADGTVFPADAVSSVFTDSTEQLHSHVFFQDISARKLAENALVLQNDYLSKLTQFSIDLSNLSSDENLEVFIPKRIKELTGALAAIYSEYDEETRMIIPKQIELEPGLLKKTVNLFGKRIQKIHSPVNDETYKEITSSVVGKLNSLTEASFGAIPKTVGAMVSNLLKADRYIALVYLIEGNLYGTSLLAMSKQQQDPPIEFLRNIAFLVAVSLRRKRAEVIQKETLDRLLKIASQLPGVVYQFRLRPDGSSCFPFASDSVYDIYGLTPEELREDASKAFALLQPEVYNRIKATILTSAKELSLWQQEIPVVFGDGNVHTLFSNAIPQPEDDGSILWHGFIADITGHKRAEEELLESRQFTEEIINSIPIGVFWKNRNFVYLGCNKQFATDAGFNDPKEIIGQDDFMLGGPIERIKKYHSEDLQVVQSGEPMLLIEDTQTTSDGNTFTVLTNKIPLLNHKGEIIGVLGTNMDITERKRNEESLIASETRYRRLFESAKDGILILDAETGKIVDVNPFLYNLLGFSEHQLLGVEIWEIGLFKDIVANQAKFFELQQNNYVRYDDLPLETIDGKKINVEFVSNVYFADKKRVIQCNIRDITARKLVESQLKTKHLQLQKINAEKDKFFSIIAHDLRSPFNGFLGLTEILASDLAAMSPDEINKMAILMKKSATNLFGLLGNLLEWSRMQRGLIAFVPSLYLLKPKIHDNVVLIKDAADKKKISLSINVPEDMMIFADENMLGGILRNLVTNAVKFTPVGGNITVSARPIRNKLVEISVKDSGIGMSKDLIDNLFHLDINTNRKGTEGEYSTGLGLMICKDFIEKNGGELFIESEEGKGSDFKFTLPMNSNTLES